MVRWRATTDRRAQRPVRVGVVPTCPPVSRKSPAGLMHKGNKTPLKRHAGYDLQIWEIILVDLSRQR